MLTLLAIIMSPLPCAGFSFITLGDWGGALPGKPYAQNVKDVAAQMAKTAEASDVKFIVNTGDNFYWCGIENTSDFQVQKDWLEPYSAAPLQIPWYGILGNHEYGYNVSAQIDLGKIYKTWIMDARYYTRRVQLQGSNYVSMIFLDSSPCVQEYRADSKSGWDPCGEFPTCSLSGGSGEFEGKCNFHENILSQDCASQLAWFKKALAAVPKDDWLIVVGHHPAQEMNVEDLTAAMQSHGFDLYLNGHVHTLNQYTVDGSGAYVTSGAGSLVISRDQLPGTPHQCRTHNMSLGLDVGPVDNGHQHESVFTAHTSGFTLHTFSSDFSSLTTIFMDASGNKLHSFTVKKGQGPSPPSPSPGPSPPAPPPSSGSCKEYGCGKYDKQHSCQCNSYCKSPSDCCSDFDAVCGGSVVV
jgi:3',5'-cyclic AMP phosphodiesterase CpdA